MTDRTQFNLRLPETMKHFLMSTGNASAYVREAIEERRRQYRQGLAFLQKEGWKPSELHAMIVATEELSVNPTDNARLALSISLGSAGTSDFLKKWGISKERWDKLISAVETRFTVAKAFLWVRREFYSDASQHVHLSQPIIDEASPADDS
jgi:hypothetical protein